MSSLYKRATPSQAMVLRIVEGAIRNAAHAHPDLEISARHRRSIAKRATGTLTAQWPDVLAAKPKRQKPSEIDVFELNSGPERRQQSHALKTAGREATGFHRFPLRTLRKKMVRQMTEIRLSGDVARYAAWQDVLRMIADLGCAR